MLTYTRVQNCLECDPCPQGQYISTPCTGTGYSKTDRVCSDCRICDTGEYIHSDCVGNTITDTKSCKNCLSCAVDFYIYAQCSGLGTTPTHQCSQCSTCGSLNGLPQYVSQHCDGNGFSPSDRICSICTCPIGYKMSEICSGGEENQKCVQDDTYVPPTTRAGSVGTTTSPGVQLPGTTPIQYIDVTTTPINSTSSGALDIALIAGIAVGVIVLMVVGCILVSIYGTSSSSTTGVKFGEDEALFVYHLKRSNTIEFNVDRF
jgi:hypothetical protein